MPRVPPLGRSRRTRRWVSTRCPPPRDAGVGGRPPAVERAVNHSGPMQVGRRHLTPAPRRGRPRPARRPCVPAGSPAASSAASDAHTGVASVSAALGQHERLALGRLLAGLQSSLGRGAGGHTQWRLGLLDRVGYDSGHLFGGDDLAAQGASRPIRPSGQIGTPPMIDVKTRQITQREHIASFRLAVPASGNGGSGLLGTLAAFASQFPPVATAAAACSARLPLSMSSSPHTPSAASITKAEGISGRMNRLSRTVVAPVGMKCSQH